MLLKNVLAYFLNEEMHSHVHAGLIGSSILLVNDIIINEHPIFQHACCGLSLPPFSPPPSLLKKKKNFGNCIQCFWDNDFTVW